MYSAQVPKKSSTHQILWSCALEGGVGTSSHELVRSVLACLGLSRSPAPLDSAVALEGCLKCERQ